MVPHDYSKNYDWYFAGERIYWCDHNSELIQAADLDGSNMKTLVELHESANPFGITFYNDHIYWTDWNIRGVSKARIDGTNQVKVHEEFFTGLNEIVYFSKSLIPSKSCFFI